MATAIAHAPSDSPDLSARLWTQDLPREHGFEPLTVEGTLPAELRGTLYRNGPGQFGQFGRRYTHPFEGDGAVTAVRFADGRALGAAKLTATTGLADERAAGRILYGTGVPWLRKMSNLVRGRHKNTANTSVVMWQGRLFALMEGGLPTELDPRDLATRGETDLDGTVVSMFSAHPHRVAARRAIYNFGLEYGRQTRLHVYELPDAAPARHLAAIPLPFAPMVHDFIATPSHLVFFLSPVKVQVPRMLLGVGDFGDYFRWRPELGTEIICVRIDAPDQVVRFTVDAFYQWHFANAHNYGTELIVDYVRYASFDSFTAIGDMTRAPSALYEGRPHRAVIDLAGRTLVDHALSDHSAEFPTVAPRVTGAHHGYTYLAVDGLSAVGKLDHASGQLVAHALTTARATEPVFVPRPGGTREDDGWLLVLCHDGPSSRAFVGVYDAARVADGPLARAWFDHHVPITFHGVFAPSDPVAITLR